MLRTHVADCKAETTGAPDFVDITESVQDALESSGIRDGQVTLFCPEENCTILVNEAETGLFADLRRTMGRLDNGWPPTAIGSRSVVVPAADGRLRLGTWQRLLLVELDGAATRSIVVQILGEA
ncbi:MAG: YjbQ family protein [Actinomycetota bacterium]